MMFWDKTRRTALLVAAVALAILIGTGAVMAAQSHVGPFSSSNAPANAKSSAHDGEHDPTETDQPNQGDDQKLTGTILSIDTTGQTFVLTPDDGSAVATIAFDANTNIENEDGSNPLSVGAHITVEVVTRADGSLYAKEIKLVESQNQQEPGEDQELTGIIQSVDTTNQAFVLAPDDGSPAVTISFDSNTNIEHEDGDNGRNPLTAGAHVTVEVVTRADGSLYAKEIQFASSGDGNGGGSDGDGHGGSGGSSGGGSGGGSDGGGSGH